MKVKDAPKRLYLRDNLQDHKSINLLFSFSMFFRSQPFLLVSGFGSMIDVLLKGGQACNDINFQIWDVLIF